MKRRHVLMFGVVAIAAPLHALWWASEEPMLDVLDEPAGTQIVVQWFDDSPMNSSTHADPLLAILDAQSQNLYEVDSFDLGSGTMNIFLYADNPDPAVKRVIQLSEEGLLPKGMRIGVAETQGGDQATRHYRPAYPPDLKTFQLLYAVKTTAP